MDKLRPATQDMTRAVRSLMEELEAADWYRQREDACGDEELRQILRHNAREEKEHASMLLEWIRRRDPEFDAHLRTYLFQGGSILESEAGSGQEAGTAPEPHAFTVGSLRAKPG